MIGNVLAKRYAKALIEPLREDDVEVVRKDLDTFQNIFQISPEIRKLFLGPVFGFEEKKNVLQVLSERLGFSRKSHRFFELLLEKDRLKYLKEIRAFFENLLYERRNKMKAYVTSSDSFSTTHEKTLKDRLKDLTKKDIELDIRTDPSIIGGLVIKIGDVIYDGSIKGQLNSIKEGLLEKSARYNIFGGN